MNKDSGIWVWLKWSDGFVEYLLPTADGFLWLGHFGDCEKTRCDCVAVHEKNLHPDASLFRRRAEIKKRAKQIQIEVRRKLRMAGVKVNARGRLSTEQIDFVVDFNINDPLAQEWRALLRENWSPFLGEEPAVVVQENKNNPLFGLTVYKTAGRSDYHTQGYGAEKYARGYLEWHAFLLEYNGFQAIIVEKGRGWQLYSDYAGEDLDLLSVADWAQFHWLRHRNPRVYNPFLPHEPEYDANYSGELAKGIRPERFGERRAR